MSREKEIDPRQRLIALAIAIVIVLGGNFIYGFARKGWYKNEARVVARMQTECLEMVETRLEQMGEKAPADKKAEWHSKAVQECQKIKDSCEKNFQQEMCVLAQKQFQSPE